MRSGLSSWCRECANAASRDWRARNRDKIQASNLARRTTSAEGYLRKCVVCGTEFRRRTRHAFVCGAGKCQRARRDPEKLKAEARRKNANRNHLRRAQLRAALSDDPALAVTAALVRDLLAQAKSCPICRKRLSEKRGHPQKKHLDHVVPLAVGGAHTTGNVRVICATCNLSRPRNASDVEQETLWARTAV